VIRDALLTIVLPTVGYFIAVVFCIGIVIFVSGIAADLVSDPTTFAEQAQ
jgi:hypothetical protein